MVIIASDAIDVHGHACMHSKTMQAMWNHFCAQVANLFSFQSELYDGVRTVGEIDDGTREGFVKGRICVAEPSQTVGAAQSIFESGPDGYEGVFRGVMVVD